MSKGRTDEEIDLKQVYELLKHIFIKIIKFFFRIIEFYKKRALLFTGLIVMGVVSGWFLDKKLNISNLYVQEIIIAPKYESRKFIYDFAESLNNNLEEKNEVFFVKTGINSDLIKNIKKIRLEPIIQATNILDEFKKKYDEDKSFYDFVLENKKDQFEEEKFMNFYKYHKLVFYFTNKNKENYEIVDLVLNYIKSNIYYKKVLNLAIKQTKESLELNKNSLKFIDNYLDKISQSSSKKGNEIVILTDESETSTIASLLKQKALLIEKVNNYERIIAQDNELFSEVHRGEVLKEKLNIDKRMIVGIPLFLFSIVTFIFLLKKGYRIINES